MIVAAPDYRDFVLQHWLDWRREGKRCALLTLVVAHGGSPRPVGSQVAVCEDGRHVGLISGGCIEKALVLDAIAAIEREENHVERYGDGSRFVDLRLPCGSGIDIAFDVGLGVATVEAVVAARAARREAVLETGGFLRVYPPAPRLIAVGQGPIMTSTLQFAAALEMEPVAYSPDPDTLEVLRGLGFTALALEAFGATTFDRHTAVLTLFHDHDHEADILARAVTSEAFYIGALGSRRAQAARLERLALMGLDDAGARINGPVGLDIGARTPPEIALSALAEIVQCYRQ
ncbi:XdhC family protein [Asticcacaulis sp. AC402]|uniref:XdhC family protein n=1 Tax=Asticcacaulis sp. AC402 TaxID=1282361 RepID=UPI0003C3E532|nr:XdhC family protein [Asticcacaulis sp. AC402]ESQ77468.1 xdhC and CoxI family protein [Asticcacaulis sp. AC402]